MTTVLPFALEALAMEPRYSHNTLILFELSLDFRFQHSRNCTTHSFDHNDRLSNRTSVLRCASSPSRSLRSAHEPRHVPKIHEYAPLFHHLILLRITRYVSTLLCSTAMIPTLDVPFSQHRPG